MKYLQKKKNCETILESYSFFIPMPSRLLSPEGFSTTWEKNTTRFHAKQQEVARNVHHIINASYIPQEGDTLDMIAAKIGANAEKLKASLILWAKSLYGKHIRYRDGQIFIESHDGKKITTLPMEAANDSFFTKVA